LEREKGGFLKIHFLGAVRSVTGSCHILETNGTRILVDCGFFQGRREESNYKNRNLLFDPLSIDRMVLGHAHIDHSGNIPTLAKKGYNNSIYSTFATRDLCVHMLLDSAHIQDKDAQFLNEKNERKGIPPIEPLYTVADVENALSLFRGSDYHKSFYVCKNVKVTFFDAGHILGSALTFFEIEENGKKFKLLYAVDLGRKNLPILRDPEQVKDIDFLIIESTYGNRFHDDIADVENQLALVVNNTFNRKGKIIVPAFAVERTQEIVYVLHKLTQEKRIPPLPIFVDSPLSTNVTQVFRMHPECFDEKTKEEFARDKNPFGLENITYIQDIEESKKLNHYDKPAMIISASGMGEAGRILHHLKNNIENSRNTILIVGFMAKNTLGRKILEKQPQVRIFGEEYKLNAEVVVMNSFSAHADRGELLEYVENAKANLKKVFVVHGEEEQSYALASGIKELGISEVFIPQAGEIVEI
jgi:metallo-beta-lactamase family protein